jgi:hypothetical protein
MLGLPTVALDDEYIYTESTSPYYVSDTLSKEAQRLVQEKRCNQAWRSRKEYSFQSSE